MNIIRLSATNPHITFWYSESFARFASCGFTIWIGVVPVGVATGAGAVGATTTGATGAGAVGAGAVGATTTTGATGAGAVGAGAVGATTTTGATGAGAVGAETGDDTVVVTGVDTVVVTGAGVATGVADVLELLVDPPPPPPVYTAGAVGAELSTGVGVVVIVVDVLLRSIFVASIFFLRSDCTVALTRVSCFAILVFTCRIACTNERDFLFAIVVFTIAFASATFCL